MGVKGRPGLILNPQALRHSHDLTCTDIREAVVRADFGRAALEGGMALKTHCNLHLSGNTPSSILAQWLYIWS